MSALKLATLGLLGQGFEAGLRALRARQLQCRQADDAMKVLQHEEQRKFHDENAERLARFIRSASFHLLR
jgi:hypothetical protein